MQTEIEPYNLLFDAVKTLQAQGFDDGVILETLVHISAMLAGLAGGSEGIRLAIVEMEDWQRVVQLEEKKAEEAKQKPKPVRAKQRKPK